jgi:hypothetical protein
LHANDAKDFDIVAKPLPQACDFIESHLQAGRCVLVNCYAGENRSVAVVVGFLVFRKGRPLLETIQHVMAVRGRVLTNRHFRYLLVRAALSPETRDISSGSIDCVEAIACNSHRGHNDVQEFGSNAESLLQLGCKRGSTDASSNPPVLGIQTSSIDDSSKPPVLIPPVQTSTRVRRVAGGLGHVVHGLCFEFSDGTRKGSFLEDNRSIVDLTSDFALSQRNAVWEELGADEFITDVSGHGSWTHFLAADVVLHISSGREISFCGSMFEYSCTAPFKYHARVGHEISDVFFNHKQGTCTGVQNSPIPDCLVRTFPSRDTDSHRVLGDARDISVKRIACGAGLCAQSHGN